MDYGALVNSVGLILNIIGVVIIFKYGFPQPSFDEGVSIVVEDATVFADGTTAQQLKEDAIKNKNKFRKFSYLGLGFILIGLIFQLIATNI
jgi:hypothetical protein